MMENFSGSVTIFDFGPVNPGFEDNSSESPGNVLFLGDHNYTLYPFRQESGIGTPIRAPSQLTHT